MTAPHRYDASLLYRETDAGCAAPPQTRRMTTSPILTKTQRFPAVPKHHRGFPALLRRRTWTEFAYAVLGLPIGIATFVFTVVVVSVGASLAVPLIGLPLLAAGGRASRRIGGWLRSLANTTIDADVPPSQPFRARPGALGWIRSCMAEGTAWRAQVSF